MSTPEASASGSEQEVQAIVPARAGVVSSGRGFERSLPGHLPPVHLLEEIYCLLVHLGVDAANLLMSAKTIQRMLRIGTLCSGTESPVMALRLLCDALASEYGLDLRFDHVMSAEIEPYKQAYITRNFQPELLFRDIMEFINSHTATTAYGTTAQIPANLDLLVAGFSCVDFSRLNSSRKQLEDHGESGDTFRAILHYAKQFRPKIVILENVVGAPWQLIRAIWRNDLEFLRSEEGDRDWDSFWAKGDLAYASEVTIVDTKDYFLPQTRQRGYMACFDRSQFEDADAVARQWKDMILRVERPATSPMEAFLFAEDDPRLHQMRDSMNQIAKRKTKAHNPQSWDLCKGRYESYRLHLNLGHMRPFTNWAAGGKKSGPDHWWRESTSSHGERVHESLEINSLRSVGRGVDPTCKARVWELSQNVDRAADTAPMGMIGCLIPTGLPFLTTQGRFLAGVETLSLNGLPRDKLLMPRETTKEIMNLAGNAMSSTVVGAAIMAAICVCPIGTFDGKFAEENVSSINPLAAMEMREDALGQFNPLDLLSFRQDSAQILFQQARNSIRLCRCEGFDNSTDRLIRICRDCSHTACEKCAGIPLHSYRNMDQPTMDARIAPADFTEALKASLPMRLQVAGLEIDILNQLRPVSTTEVDKKLWTKLMRALTPAVGEELRFKTIKRTHKWRVIFEASHSLLTLTFSEHEIFWQLHVKANPKEPVNSLIRKLLKPPFAMMHVKGGNLISGQWQICLPTTKTVVLKIRGIGTLIPCWPASIGMQIPSLVDKKVWSRLRISAEHGMHSEWTDQITGEYELLQGCDSAMHHLHKRIHSPRQSHGAPVYFFFDSLNSGRLGEDRFVFSRDKHHLAYPETRMIIASIDPRWRPSSQGSTQVTCSFALEMMDCEAALKPFTGPGTPMYAAVTDRIDDVVATGLELSSREPSPEVPHQNCSADVHTILSCKVPLSLVEDNGWQPGPWVDVDHNNEYLNFATFSWLLDRVRTLDGFSDRYRSIPPPENITMCRSCAPSPPSTQWRMLQKKSGKPKLIAHQDARQAEAYERAMKARPAPFLTRIRIDGYRDGCLQVGLNVTTLVHRALAKFSQHPSVHNALDVSWRLDSQYEWPTKFPLEPFKLGSNEKGTPMPHEFVVKETREDGSSTVRTEKLRKDQEESLFWIVQQESPELPPFHEMEIEEACVRSAGWRAEARVQRPSTGRGGILADDIGYGKTITTLALIDRQMPIARASSKTPRENSIPLKATLIIVPAHLFKQWKRQIYKFLGGKYAIVKIASTAQLRKLAIKNFKNAHIVLVSGALFDSPSYLAKIAQFAALPEVSTLQQRYFGDWMRDASERIGQHTEDLKHCTDMSEYGKNLNETRRRTIQQHRIMLSLPAKRLTGAAYMAKAAARREKELKQVQSEFLESEQTATASKDGDPFKTEEASTMDDLSSPVLSMFHFERVVIDEYTYISNKRFQFMNSIKSNFRWVLSGTPRLGDFQDVKMLAAFIGVYLGVDDDTSPVMQHSNVKDIRESRTDAERFHALTQEQSPAWHTSRHAHAQKFLDHFARKNIVEFGKIPSIHGTQAVSLMPTHRALYLELQQQLQSHDMRLIHGGKGQGDNDRVNRIRGLLAGSASAEEALVKSAAYFNIPTTEITDEVENAHSNARDFLIEERNDQYQDVCEEINTTLRHAAWLEKQCSRISKNQSELISDIHYDAWKRHVRNNTLGDPDVTAELLKWILHAEEHYQFSHQDQFYRRTAPTPKESLQHKKYIVFKEKQLTLERAVKAALQKPTAKSSKAKTKTPAVMNADELAGFRNEAKFKLPVAINAQHSDRMVLALRAVTAHLRALNNDQISRKRALRFLQNVRKLQLWQSELGDAVHCDSCMQNFDPANIFVLGVCGHVVCTNCLATQDRASDQSCVIKNCLAAVQAYHVHSALEMNSADDPLAKYGAKLDEIVKTINGISNYDQVLLFVQFDALIEQVAKVLELEKITHYAIHATSRDALKNIDDFQENATATRRKVLILNPTSESAAGANITNANHVIFLAPIVKGSFLEYVAPMQQCIGRALRHGQLKKVYIYHFLALKTIDVDIFQERSEMRLAKSRAGNWVWKYENDLTPEQKVINWGTGIDIYTGDNEEEEEAAAEDE